MTFLGADGLAVGKNVSEWSVFWQIWLSCCRRGGLGLLIAACWVEVTRAFEWRHARTPVRANVGPEADAARQEARATSLGRVACFITAFPLAA